MGATQGTEASGNGRTLGVACGALARELLHVVEVNGLDRIDVECLPASYHNEPDRIPPAVADRVRGAVERYDRIFVGYADCGTGGRLDAVCEELGVERLPGAHCYEFFTGGADFAQLQEAELGTFYLTTFWRGTSTDWLSKLFGWIPTLNYLPTTSGTTPVSSTCPRSTTLTWKPGLVSPPNVSV